MRLFILFLLWPALLLAQPALPVTEVAPGIFVHFARQEFPNPHNHDHIANIGFIVGQRCVAVIDTGGSPLQGQALKKAIENTTDKPVCYVINTHVHPDHIYGNRVFKQPGVKFIGHYRLSRAMAARAPFDIDRAKAQWDVELRAEDIVPPDFNIHKQMRIDLGQRYLLLTAHPTAHTDNDLSIWDEKTNTAWLADLLFIDHIPTLDGSLKGWLNEISKLEKQTYRFVVPGHGPLATDWPQAIQPEKRYLQILLTEIREQIKQGKYLEDAVKTVGLSEKPHWQLFDAYHQRNVMSAFAELEWEDE
ncbi:quinoprotein relay system zinc metallohydrolase 2 [methane-oxidizing endosymbiont of Gigantopelta aegis]|uniref:quinoprotein relay system zinc metallohydrolase 2 n=1 Tax=methane-oxidizing endosymbiont of Gigantopelta aegis TaxID=2794938 RepID=UPI0018DC2530|nr:quinoprotein relay system zinc metallohydrolase 2 [methane-oxidizing endosymbiont of Gigantopelta aegis]